MFVTSVVFYLSTRFAGCSVDPGINRGTHKLARTFRVIKKKTDDANNLNKKNTQQIFYIQKGFTSANSRVLFFFLEDLLIPHPRNLSPGMMIAMP
jgi:hypothetical protein